MKASLRQKQVSEVSKVSEVSEVSEGSLPCVLCLIVSSASLITIVWQPCHVALAPPPAVPLFLIPSAMRLRRTEPDEIE
jgi:hypothetical protein